VEDGVAEDRDKEREEGQERPSRPVTAAARRERRASARPAAKKTDSSAAKPSGKTAPKDAVPKAAEKKVAKKAVAKSDAKPAADAKGRPTPTRDRKESKGSLFSRLLRFLREVVAELRKVIWPTRKQMITYTAVVLVFLAFMITLVSLLDLAFGKGVFWLFG